MDDGALGAGDAVPVLLTAVVLAGDRGVDDPLVRATGLSCKAVIPVGGRPMVLRVLDALAAATSVGEVILCGPAEEQVGGCPPLLQQVKEGAVRWIAPRASPCLSVSAALESLPEATPVLVTTADHALLSAATVDAFCAGARASGADLAVGVAALDRVLAAFPGTRRTAFRLRGGAWCGCNLFAFLTPRSRRAAEFWRRVERDRKRPLRVARLIGWGILLGYVARRFTLERALRKVSERMGLAVGAVILESAEAAVDVDSVEDLASVEGRVTHGESA